MKFNNSHELPPQEPNNSNQDNKKDTSLKKSLGNALRAVSAGALLLSQDPAYAESLKYDPAKITEIDQEITALEEKKSLLQEQKRAMENAKRTADVHEWIKDLKINNLKLEEPLNPVGQINEQFGVYTGDKHLGDVISPKDRMFSKNTLISEINNLLSKEKAAHDHVKNLKEKLTISPQAKDILTKWKWRIDYNNSAIHTNDNNQTIAFQPDTKSVQIIVLDENMLMIVCKNLNGSQTIVTCANGDIKNVK